MDRVPQCRPNTSPKFSVFEPSVGFGVTSTLKPDRWRTLLQTYPDPEFANTIAGIAQFGARVGYKGPIVRIRGRNHSSVLRIPDEITQNVIHELAASRIRQIPTLPPFYYVSPLGAVEKRLNGEFNGWRRIHDLSYPNGGSVNDHILEEYGSLTYQTLDDAIRLIQKHGRRCILRKRDLKDAFRKIPVSPLDHWLFLFEWNGILYIDLFLPFGLRTAPLLFNLFAEGLHWILDWICGRDLVHYLDDFLLFDDPSPEFFGNVASYLGLSENIMKRKDGWVVDFTGIELDSDCMVARLPKDKHDRAIAGVQRLLATGAVTHRTLEKLLGFLSFCARVVPLGRPFLCNLFNLLQRLSHLHPYAIHNLSSAARRDLLWWMTLLPQWSGVLIITPTRPKVVVHTDTSSVKGIGGWWDSHAFSARMPRAYRTRLIDWKEAYAVLFAFAKWGEFWIGHTVVIMCDNSVVVTAINSKSVHGLAIDPLQLILLTAALYDIEVTSMWLSSKDNWIADALSRFDIDKVADFVSTVKSRQLSSSIPREWETNVGITGKAADLLWHGLAPNTRHTYRVSESTFERFASSHGFYPTFPVQFEALAQFIALTAAETSTQTARSYVTRLRSYHVDHGYSTELFNDERIQRILRGAARKYGNKPKRERLAITKEILQAIVLNLRGTHDDINLRAAFCTAFAAFLRMAEFTWSCWNDKSFLQHLSRGSVQFLGDKVILTLPASKSDPFRQGVAIPLCSSGDSTCPVTALRLLYRRYPLPATAPLFSQACGPFDRQWALRKVSQSLLFSGINPKGFSGHSFRRGAAISAVNAGIAKSDIMKMGRWKSDSVERYFSAAAHNNLLFSLSTQLHTNPGPSPFIPDPQCTHSSSTHSTPRVAPSLSTPRVSHKG